MHYNTHARSKQNRFNLTTKPRKCAPITLKQVKKVYKVDVKFPFQNMYLPDKKGDSWQWLLSRCDITIIIRKSLIRRYERRARKSANW